MSPKTKTRRNYFQSITVDVDIDESVLEENGYHHEDDCPSNTQVEDSDVDLGFNLRQLSDWHDRAHGLNLWSSCMIEPCRVLAPSFRTTA
ncbi:hypothetical protein [Paenarthrobacter ureafaciens]|uniref:hypothetical protein n=1 Tax=Paenarthrobacter ureafaciens TaxID=37931 RepID=UPI001FB33F46|nr:hypothetical protein [Paenarthrobacter ureafaciens]UOD80324.1 hypothetical protein MQZ73_14545 [Paenarthrobacter ureafaciens]WNZ02975.1 hypothetical protein PVT25_15175 [Paenarthrobacter ureafaciens]